MIGVITSALAVFALGGDTFVTTTEAGAVAVNYTTNAFGASSVCCTSGFWGWRGQTLE